MTAAVASESGQYLFTSGKEGHIIKWDLSTGKKLASFFKVRENLSDRKGKGRAPPDPTVKGHTDEVLSLALSGDGKLLASAGRDRRLCIWDTEKGEWIKSFSGHLGHKDAISVCFSSLFLLNLTEVLLFRLLLSAKARQTYILAPLIERSKFTTYRLQ